MGILYHKFYKGSEIMKITYLDPQYKKLDEYSQKVYRRAVKKLLNRLQYYLDQGKRIDNIFGDDILIHDIVEKNQYVYKCYINSMQMRILYTVKDDELIIISHYVKKDKPKEWLPFFENISKKMKTEVN